MKKIITSIISLILVLIFIRKLLNKIIKKLIFAPCKKNIKQYENYLNDEKIIHETIKTEDNVKLSACLYNSNKKPTYDDKIILFSHGNSGILSKVIYTYIIKELSNYGSIFIYDYRGYGDSRGVISDVGTFEDIKAVWNFLIEEKKILPENIIIFGHSLGTSISMYLIKYLVEKNKEYPKNVILQNPFYCIKRLAKEIVPMLAYFVDYKYKTYEFIKFIEKKCKDINIILIHSGDDELIDVQHSHDLKNIIKNNNCNLYIVDGGHNNPIYDKKIYECLKNVCQ